MADGRSGRASPTALRCRVSPGAGLQLHPQRIDRPQIAEPVRPFHQHDVIAGLVPAEFVQRVGSAQPPQIEMVHRTERGLVALHQGEGGAGHLQRRVAGRGAQEGAGEGRLAGTERAFQQDDVALARQRRHGGGEVLGRGRGLAGRSGGRRASRAICRRGGVGDNGSLIAVALRARPGLRRSAWTCSLRGATLDRIGEEARHEAIVRRRRP